MWSANRDPPALSVAQRIGSLVPICRWRPHRRRSWLGLDLMAGTTLATYAIAVSLAYASLAGLPPETGLFP